MSTNNVIIRPAKRDDIGSIHRLIKELAEFEKEAHSMILSKEELEEDGFGQNPLYKAHVALVNDEIAGFTLHYMRYSTWKGKSVYLEDFLVNEKFRGQGIGKALFDNLVSICKDLGVRQMNWQVLDWNQTAIDFYDRYETIYEDNWLNAKIDFTKKASS